VIPCTHNLMTGEDVNTCCHSNLVRAAVGDGLEEGDVHVVLNVFMCTPISTSTSPSPVRWRRAITSNSWPRSTLLVSALTRPRCDVSVACGDRGGVPVCYPLTVEIYKPREGWVELGGERVRWRARPGVPRRRRRGYGCGAPALRFGRSLSLSPPFAALLSLCLCVRVVQVPMPCSDGVNKLIKQSSNYKFDHYFRDSFLV
jgi:hypothetical protein